MALTIAGARRRDARAVLVGCDPLVSARVYRAAWTHERAIALLRESAGTEFDRSCVEALARVPARERGDALAVAA